jgi:hypothetical protein
MKRSLRPVSTLGWWAFWLGIATIVWGLLLTSLPGLVRTLAERSENFRFPVPVGFSGGVLELILAIAAIVTGAISIKRGERSWLMLLTFALTVIIGGFWILFALGEVLYPH